MSTCQGWLLGAVPSASRTSQQCAVLSHQSASVCPFTCLYRAFHRSTLSPKANPPALIVCYISVASGVNFLHFTRDAVGLWLCPKLVRQPNCPCSTPLSPWLSPKSEKPQDCHWTVVASCVVTCLLRSQKNNLYHDCHPTYIEHWWTTLRMCFAS